jgi:uncharacterized protein (TIGR03437 family)
MKMSVISTRGLLFSLTLILGICGLLLAQGTRGTKANNNAKKRITSSTKSQKATSRRGNRTKAIDNAAVQIDSLQKGNASADNPQRFRPSYEMEQLGLNNAPDIVPFGRKRGKSYDEPDAAAQYFLLRRLPEGENELPLEKYVEAQDQMRTMPQYSTALERSLPSRTEIARGTDPEQGKLGAWTPLGPGNIGGRTRAVVINPQDPNIMYAGGVSGGVWKSTNAGAGWTPVSDLIANIPVSALALDPADPNVLYAGTGEGFEIGSVNNVNITGAHRGLGIYKSIDGGANWTRLAATANTDFFYINDLVISPSSSQRIYAATQTGVWRSLDGGTNWTKVLNPTTSTGTFLRGGCLDLAIRADQQKDVVFASCGTRVQASIFRNIDAGATPSTWTEVFTEASMGRTALAIAPSNPTTIYAVSTAYTGSFTNALHAVFRSTSNGDSGTWTARVRNTSPNKLNRAILSAPPFALSTDCKYGTSDSFSGQGFFDLAIAIDPMDENRLWVGGIDLFRSDDGGANWGLAGYSYDIGPGSSPRFIIGKTHPDQHVIVFHPQFNGTSNQQMFVGNDGGLFRTDNARAMVGTALTAPCNPDASEVRWTMLNNNYGVTQFYQGTVHPDGKSYFGGTQDNGTVFGNDSGGVNQWKLINGGDGGYGHFDFLNPDTLYASSQGLSLRKSTDGGATFSIATFGINEGGLFITPTAIDPSDPKRLYYGARSLFRTSNGASSWTNVSGAVISTLISAIAIAPTDANMLIVGTTDGTLFRTSRILNFSPTIVFSSETEVSALPRTGFISWVAFDPTNKNIAYATYSTFGGAHVWRTINGGVSWTSIDGTGNTAVPDIPVHCIVVDPSNTARLYIGTDLGVFVSTDGGASWSLENTGFANVLTESLAVNVTNGVTTLYAFTHGRGAWKVTANNSGCNYALSSTGRDFGPSGGETTVNVSVSPNGCSWQAESNAPWITLQPGAGGNSNGTVGIRIGANTSLVARAGTVNIAGRSFTVNQEGLSDIEVPKISITNPSTPTAETIQPVFNIIGSASDNNAISSVTWRTNTGVSGTASGRNAWNAVVPLTAGQNVITFTAADPAGNVSSAGVTINSRPASVFVTVVGTGNSAYNGENLPAAATNITRPYRMTFDSAGNLYFNEDLGNRVRKVSPSGVVTTVAGNGIAGFDGDGGQATAARLRLPSTVAIDKDSNLYIADYSNHRIRKVTASTGVITTVAGNGILGFSGDDGPAINASLNFPESVAVDKDGNLYIADSSNHRIRKVTASTGIMTTAVGTGASGFGGDGGLATAAMISFPLDVAFDKAGDLYVCAAGNARIRKVTMSTGIISTYAGNGSTFFNGDGVPATNAAFGPIAFSFDKDDNLYITDASNSRIRRVNASDKVISTLAGGATGFSPDGSGAIGGRLLQPVGVAADPSGTVLFGDSANLRIRKVVSALSGDNVLPTIAITSPTNAPNHTAASSPVALSGTAADNNAVAAVRWINNRGGSGAGFGTTAWSVPAVTLQPGVNNISVTAWDANGNANSAQIAVTYAPQQVLVTVAGTGRSGSQGDGGPGVAADLALPRGIAVDGTGNIYVADSNNRRVRKISSSGQISAFAGRGELGSSGDGGPAVNATMNSPTGLTLDATGNLYISDSNNNRVRKVSPDGRIVTVAGSGKGSGGFGGDGGPATNAELAGPQGIATDTAGNLYIADRNNHAIRKVTVGTGIITTVAGTGTQLGFAGDDGPATQALLFAPSGVAVDTGGNIYITDELNQRIRRVNASDGKISTIAGNGTVGYNGDGIQARNALINLSFPSFISVDPMGDVIFADRSNHRIRKITMSTGVISTIAGNGIPGSVGDGSAPGGASLLFPHAGLVDAGGNLYISDGGNNRVRRTLPASTLSSLASVSAASFIPSGNLASESIAAAFGANLSTGVLLGDLVPLPTTLSGATLRVRDNLDVERAAPLFFVSPGQINFQVPNGTANGVATVTVSNTNGVISTGTVNISAVAPGLFSANASGQGVAAAIILRRNSNGQDTFEPVARFDSATNSFVPIPIDLGPEGDQVFLIAFGTGFRFNSGLANCRATIGGVNAQVLYSGITPGLIGLDQANLRIDRSLIGKGEVDVVLTVDGVVTNNVRLHVK